VYSIGEFSKITGITVKALRFYHDKGLLVPDRVHEPSGYRYYSPTIVTRARAILHLKEMMVPLEAIGEILDSYDDEADLLSFFIQHRTQIASQIATLRGVTASLDQIIAQERKAQTMSNCNDFEVEEKDVDTLLIASIRWRGKYGDCGKALSALYSAFGRYACGKPMDLYFDEDHKDDDADIETAIPIRKGTSVPGITVRELPGGKAISLIYKGPYELIGQAYGTLTLYARERQLNYLVPVRQIYRKGPGLIFKNPKNYLTELLFMLS
jgi:DNA-binding transcriptional MerR regulator/effector-binding domain-containing protein